MKRSSLHLRSRSGLLIVLTIVALVGCSMPWAPASEPAASATPISQSAVSAGPTPEPQTEESKPTPTSVAVVSPTSAAAPAAGSASDTPASPEPTADPFDLLSLESLLAFLEDLTAIQPYSGWRNSGSEGEAEALDYVAGKLGALGYLQSLGLELERQSFHILTATELWETGLSLTVAGQEVEVLADGLRANRDDVSLAINLDSDGVLNDAELDPVIVEGPVVMVRSLDELTTLRRQDIQGKIVFLDYALVDRIVIGTQEAGARAYDLIDKGPAGVVLVTSFSNDPGVSHGAFVGDLSPFVSLEHEGMPPVLYARLEDLAPAGIESWEDLVKVEAARLIWDADVFAPGTSENLMAHIPGADPGQAVILGAHIDSPNAPGAMDDGSGSAILLEVARVLNAAQVQPPTDLYLVWFGSEELGLAGAYHFVTTHQELLDRARAMLQIDCLTRPLDGIDAELRLVFYPAGKNWPHTLVDAAAGQGVDTVPHETYSAYSDNSTFGGFDLLNADLIYEPVVSEDASVHYFGHIHDPYDTVELAREMGSVLEEMAHVALTAALDPIGEDVSLTATPGPGGPGSHSGRILFVASHTEAPDMTPAGFTEMGMALAGEGADVDVIPYGQAVTLNDLDAGLVIVLPVLDLPDSQGDLDLYDEAWTQDEVDALEAYVASGGLLVLTNSQHRLKYGARSLEPNEDWEDANALASRFGITYQQGSLKGGEASIEGKHPLMEGLQTLRLSEGNGVPFGLSGESEGQVLAMAGNVPAAALVAYGDAGGEVLVLADVGSLSSLWEWPHNYPFWQNLARYARSR
ncbi:MAG: M28 family peptidase [Anaerolineae bacterium]